jgi:membrane protein
MATRVERVERAARFELRQRVRELVDAFEEHDLLTSASAISFQVFTAIVPFLLFAFGLLGFLHLNNVWANDVAPHIEPNVSKAAFTVINDTVTRVLTDKRVFWVTAGALLTVWQVSGAVRAVIGALNRVYRTGKERSWKRRMLVSTVLAIAVGACILCAIAAATLAPLLYGDVGPVANVLLFLVRWTVVAALLTLCVGLLVRYGPAVRQPVRWVSFGSLLVIGAWILASLAFGFYLRNIASYGSVFGNLATVVVLMGYIYLSVLVFLGGAQVDSMVRAEVHGTPSGS